MNLLANIKFITAMESSCNTIKNTENECFFQSTNAISNRLYNLFDELLKELENNCTDNREKCDKLLKDISYVIILFSNVQIDITQLKELFNMYQNCYEENTNKSNLRILIKLQISIQLLRLQTYDLQKKFDKDSMRIAFIPGVITPRDKEHTLHMQFLEKIIKLNDIMCKELTSQRVSYHDKPITLQVQNYADNIIKKLRKPLHNICNVVLLETYDFYQDIIHAARMNSLLLHTELKKIQNITSESHSRMYEYIIKEIKEMEHEAFQFLAEYNQCKTINKQEILKIVWIFPTYYIFNKVTNILNNMIYGIIDSEKIKLTYNYLINNIEYKNAFYISYSEYLANNNMQSKNITSVLYLSINITAIKKSNDQ